MLKPAHSQLRLWNSIRKGKMRLAFTLTHWATDN